MLTSMYYDRAVRIELPVADKLCKYFNCTMNDLFEFKEDVEEKRLTNTSFDKFLQGLILNFIKFHGTNIYFIYLYKGINRMIGVFFL